MNEKSNEKELIHMTNIVICGACGKMGRMLAACIREREDCSILAGIDVCQDETLGFPIYESPAMLPQKPDVIIDFSHPSCLSGLLEYAVTTGTPVVLSTTGYSDAQLAEIRNAAAQTALFSSFNMSIGIQLLIALAKKAASVLGTQFDIEIIEKHHNQKIDAPSGTALMIADAMTDVLENKPGYVYDRHSVRKKRSENEIGIHAVRGGTIVGEHDVIFAGNDELIEIKHTATSKEIFAVGAIKAARFLFGKKPGLYSMDDLIAEI